MATLPPGAVAVEGLSGLVDPRQQWPSSRTTPLIISEVMYAPPASVGPDGEFIELFNTEPVAQDLGGFQLGGQIRFEFPSNTVLAGRSYLVVAAHPALVQTRYGLGEVLGPWSNRLDNAGGTVTLKNRRGSVLLEARYSPNWPWPAAAAGPGHSLVLARPDFGEGDPRAWQASATLGGNPGAPDPRLDHPQAGVVINEVLTAAAGAQVNFVELFNAASQTVDLSGCWLTDGSAANPFRLPEGTSLAPGGFVAFDQPTLGFPLADTGGWVVLLNSNQSIVLDAHRLGAAEPGVALGRSPDGWGPLRPLDRPTPQQPNAARRLPPVLINELMFHPLSDSDSDEYIELYNRSAVAVDLAGWRFTEGVDFTFPSNTWLAAGGYLVVAKNRTNLLAKYPELAPELVVGDYAGSLRDSGETLTLSKPHGGSAGTGWVVVNQVRYGRGAAWGQWTDGGGSSLELIDPHSDNTRAMNWAGSDESTKAPWTSLEVTGPVANSLVSASARLYAWLVEAGEALLDDVEVRVNNGPNLVRNPGFDTDDTSWTAWGNHAASSRQATGGYSGAGWRQDRRGQTPRHPHGQHHRRPVRHPARQGSLAGGRSQLGARAQRRGSRTGRPDDGAFQPRHTRPPELPIPGQCRAGSGGVEPLAGAAGGQRTGDGHRSRA